MFGLKTLNEQSRISRHEIDGQHLEYGPEHIQSIIVPELLK